MSQIQYEKLDYILSTLENQGYLFKNKLFSQELLTFEENKDWYVNDLFFIDLFS